MEATKRENLRKYHRQQFKENCSWLGKKHNQQTKEKMSKRKRGTKTSTFSKKLVYDLNTGKRVYVDSLENLPSNLVLKQDFNRIKGILTKKEQITLQRKIKQQKYIQKTQEMADYYTKYGYEATCKKFPGRSGTCSPEAMLMRFIKARKKHGIKFESKVGGNFHKREFLKVLDEVSNINDI